MTSHVRRKRVGGVERLGDDLQHHNPVGKVEGCPFRVCRNFLEMSKLVIGLIGTWDGYRIKLRVGVAIGRDIGQPHDRHGDRFLGEKHQQRLDVSWEVLVSMKMCMKMEKNKRFQDA